LELFALQALKCTVTCPFVALQMSRNLAMISADGFCEGRRGISRPGEKNSEKNTADIAVNRGRSCPLLASTSRARTTIPCSRQSTDHGACSAALSARTPLVCVIPLCLLCASFLSVCAGAWASLDAVARELLCPIGGRLIQTHNGIDLRSRRGLSTAVAQPLHVEGARVPPAVAVLHEVVYRCC